jgi:hypothetical protein
VIYIGDPVENHLSAIYFISAGVGYFICTVLLSSFPKYPDLFMIIFSVYAIVINFILWDYTLSATTMALTAVALIGSLIFVSRLLAYSKAEKLIRKQRVIYDDIWIKVIDQPDAVQDLSVLNKVVRRISSATEGKTAAQFNLRIHKGSKMFGHSNSDQSSFISRRLTSMSGNRGSWMVAASIAEDLGCVQHWHAKFVPPPPSSTTKATATTTWKILGWFFSMFGSAPNSSCLLLQGRGWTAAVDG